MVHIGHTAHDQEQRISIPPVEAHIDVLESMAPASFPKPPHLGPLNEGQEALEDACERKYGRSNDDKSDVPPKWDTDWRHKVRVEYEKLAQTLWRVACEFDVRGYCIVSGNTRRRC